MIGTRKLARLLDHADYARAKVVLVGDPCQLPEIEAGGVFTGLAERLGAVELVENRRQQDPVERQALAELHAGQVDEAIERLAEHGHIIETPDRKAALEQIVADWWTATRRGEDAIMLALHRSDVTALNDTARAVLVAERVVDDWPIHVLDRPYAVGDRIMTLQNDYRHGLINGQRGTITSSELDGFHVQFDGEDRPRQVPDAYFEAGHVDHAYAMTVHKAQGPLPVTARTSSARAISMPRPATPPSPAAATRTASTSPPRRTRHRPPRRSRRRRPDRRHPRRPAAQRTPTTRDPTTPGPRHRKDRPTRDARPAQPGYPRPRPARTRRRHRPRLVTELLGLSSALWARPLFGSSISPRRHIGSSGAYERERSAPTPRDETTRLANMVLSGQLATGDDQEHGEHDRRNS